MKPHNIRTLLIAFATAFVITSPSLFAQDFIRGDVNQDGAVTEADRVMISNHLFGGGGLTCALAADANDDGIVSLGDVTFLYYFLYETDPPPPPAPYPDCGPDPTSPVAGASCCTPVVGCCVVAGDADHSGALTIADVTFLIARIFSGGPPPSCCEEGDPDGTGAITIADVTFNIARIFSGGPAPFCGVPGMSCSSH
jgi:hypothetical protein